MHTCNVYVIERELEEKRESTFFLNVSILKLCSNEM
jgi:hypothetical protein